MFAVEFFRWTVRINRWHYLVPPMIAAGFHVSLSAGSLDDDARLNRWSFLKSFIDRSFEFHLIPASPAAIGSNHSLALRIVDAIDKCSAGKSAEDNGVRCPDARAGQHRDGQLRN